MEQMVRRPSTFAVVLARVRMPLLLAATLLLFGGFAGVPWWIYLPVFVVVMVASMRAGTAKCPPLEVAPPVSGRWMALNSPADSVPSHGTQEHGQGYAIDLVLEPADGSRPDIGWRPLSRPPEDFPGFDEPVLAPADSVVLRAYDRQRDHRSRNSWPWLLGMILETTVRSLRGSSGLMGNHIVLDLGHGVYAALAHLRSGSVRVSVGERVSTGEQVAQCGNSGNSTEPHVHFQLMDHRWAWAAVGLPFRWKEFQPANAGVPKAWRPFEV